MSRRKKWILRALAAGSCLLIGALLYVSSTRFSRTLLERIRAEVLATTGMKMEAEGLAVQVWRGRVTLKRAVFHGTEPAGQDPFLRIKEVRLDVGLGTFASTGLHLRALAVDEPQLHLLIDAQGKPNLPDLPPRTTGKDPLEQLLDLRLGRLDIARAEVNYNERRFGFSLLANGLNSRFDYLPASHSYEGGWKVNKVQLDWANKPPVVASVDLRARVSRGVIAIESLEASSGERNHVKAKGDWRLAGGDAANPPRLSLDLDSSVELEKISPFLPISFRPSGLVSFKGALLFDLGRGLELHGTSKLTEGFYKDASTRFGPIQATSQVDVLPQRVVLTRMKAGGFDGSWEGAFQWDAQEGWKLEGDLDGIRSQNVLSQLSAKPIPWNGLIGGPIRASGGKQPLHIEADLEVAAADGPSPLSGLLALSYEEIGNRLFARNSYLLLADSRLQFAGDLRQGLGFELSSKNLEELRPALTLAGVETADSPFNWKKGSIYVAGSASGDLSTPRIKGQWEGVGLSVNQFDIDVVRGRLDYTGELLQLDEVNLRAPDLIITGNARLALEDGKVDPDAPLSGNLQADVKSIVSLATKLGATSPLAGAVQVGGALRGSWGEPVLEGSVRSSRLEWDRELFEQTVATFTLSRRELKVPEWESRIARQAVRGSLQMRAGGNDWRIGNGSLVVRTEGLALAGLDHFRRLDLDAGANLTTDLAGDFTWSPEGIAGSRLDGRLLLANIRRFNRPVGQLELTSRTAGNRANLTAVGSLQQLPVKGDATIQLGVRLDSEFRLQLPRLDFPALAQLLSKQDLPSPLPYVGGAEASLYFRGPLTRPAEWDGTITIPQVQLAPNKEYVRETLPQVADVVLRNERPIVIRFRQGEMTAQNVRLVAKDTNLNTSFAYRLDNQRLSGDLKGSINLAILSTIQPELLAKGTAALNTSIQGTAADPQINGKLSFSGASFYLRNVITGLDKVNGTLLFDRNRATIESLKAQTGGGDLQLSGFIGFGRIISYRLQAQANQVRIRYPEGVSTAANASLALTGTTAQSLLTGNISILRSTIGQVDTSQLLASSGTAVETPAPNEFLKNLQFDVRVETVQNAEFSTSLTKNIKGEISLRLRGSPQRPVVLGRILATQGEIDFFGSPYTINRGEVVFANPLRIEPVVNLDLETRVRGVTINMNFSGPANKLNLTYRSDPPLQSSEILALLTVGRNPNSTSSILQVPAGQAPGALGGDSNFVLGAAVNAGINGRLQRFFGISRVRLDPQLTGIDNVPQARLTLEQQVSRDVTLTYITNLNRTQQQIVRVDWDISRTWSIVAVRDENGIFGLDLFFRKQRK